LWSTMPASRGHRRCRRCRWSQWTCPNP
jgi:hypothetical protein